jgi:hypothetical protein
MHAGFSSGDRQRLRKALTRVRRARPFRRLQALLWLAEGRSISEVARLARASRGSILSDAELFANCSALFANGGEFRYAPP